MGRRRLKVRRFCFVCALGTFNLIRLTTIDASIHAHTHSHTHIWQWAEGPYNVPGGTLAIAWVIYAERVKRRFNCLNSNSLTFLNTYTHRHMQTHTDICIVCNRRIWMNRQKDAVFTAITQIHYHQVDPALSLQHNRLTKDNTHHPAALSHCQHMTAARWEVIAAL